jgi:hypothetical protein
MPFVIFAPLVSDAGVSLALFCGFLFCGAMPYGGAAASFQEITPNRMRGQVSAIYLFFLNLVGIGAAPTFVALVTESYGGDTMVSAAIATVSGIAALLSAGALLLCGRHYRQAMLPQ